MYATLAEAKAFVQDVAFGGGVCSVDDARLTGVINEAIMELLPMAHWKQTTKVLSFCTASGCLRLPRHIETVLALRTNGRAAYPFSRFYEFAPNGPGLTCNACCWAKDLVDTGLQSPLQFDLPGCTQILVTNHADDAGVELVIRGHDMSGREVIFNGEPGERITLQAGKPQYTTTKFKCVNQVIKPVTKHYVTLVDFDEGDIETTPGEQFEQKRQLLADYHPSEVNPSYRLYKLTGANDAMTHVTALCKLGYFAAVHDTDMLLISHLPALKAMVQALAKYAVSQNRDGDVHRERARVLLKEQLKNFQPHTPEVHFQIGAGMGQQVRNVR